MGLRWLVIAAVGLRATTAAADPAPEPPPAWPHTRYATGEWAGRRPSLEAHGVELLADYTAEVFARVTGARALRYRGNLNLWLTLSTEQLGWWPGGQIFVAGELAHGSGVSDGLGALTPVSNLEAESFTELSELWLDQAFGAHAGLRLGKQDVNAELGGPRFSGNFVNSSYGVPPTVPMPSFPAPGLGITARVAPIAGVELRAGAYEGAPAVGELAGWRRADGVVELGAVVVTHALRGRAGAGVHSLGVWRHTATGVDGVFGSADLRLYLSRDPDDDRSVQGFARAGYAPDAGGLDAQAYIGGGATLHGVLGRRNTIGAGAAWIRFADRAEAFVELFYKLRPLPWLTFEPDSQLYRLAGRTELVAGLRARIKL